MNLIYKDALKKDILALPNCYNGFSDTYDKACIIGVIDEQPTIEERKWISCSERLPEVKKTCEDFDEGWGAFVDYESEYVLVLTKCDGHIPRYFTDKKTAIFTAKARKTEWERDGKVYWVWEYEDYFDDVLELEVVAWMPLPEPYTEGAK